MASPTSPVLEKGYLAGGNTARNTTIVRSNYLTPEGVRFYDESRTSCSQRCSQ
jgi:glycine/D-amino acid oxidase-like deaminating enzyme